MSEIIYGLYEQIINRIINENLNKVDQQLVLKDTQPLDSAESSKILADYLTKILREIFDYIEDGDAVVRDRVNLCNGILQYIAECIRKESFSFKKDEETLKRVESFLIRQDAQILLSLVDKKASRPRAMLGSEKTVRPETSISENSLFTGAVHEPSMISELKKEILSSDRIDFLVSFIKWSGLRLIINELTQFTMGGGKLRVITTSYLGATDFKAVEQLSKLTNTEIHISYDTERTRLHAKTYVFWRDTGFSTVYIGSSNISESAMTSGLEWNIKLSQYDSGDILEKIRATFEGYWNNPEFTPFIAALDSERLRKALRSERRSSQDEANDLAFHFDLKPYYYQQEILDKLKAEREVHHSFKNLVVAATGTGKTVIAAFDYRDFCRANPNRTHKLLFVAHRKEILSQSMSCFRGILKDLNFGSMMVGGVKPDSFDDLFVSIQSFNSKDLTEVTSPDFYDYIVIDEFHQNMFAASTDDVLISDDEAVSQFDNYTAEDFLSEVFMTEERYNTLKNLLIKKKNIILQGAPGVGKTYAAERLAYSIMGEKDTSRVMVIQFHQSYSYEDFIMGYRPTESGFSLTKGPFYDFCKEAEPDDREYFFIIDEINRGNLSRIFGELLMLIENDKRGKEVRLLYSDEQFSVPENVYIIGMMNTADRSLAMIDYALRRRFAFFEFEPAFGSAGFKRYQATVANKNLDSLVGIVDAMNRVISSDASLGSGFCVGHSYFCTGDVIDDAWLSDLVEYELIPLIKEYWFDEPSKVEHWSQKLRGAIT